MGRRKGCRGGAVGALWRLSTGWPFTTRIDLVAKYRQPSVVNAVGRDCCCQDSPVAWRFFSVMLDGLARR
jgi:hypothetical protein